MKVRNLFILIIVAMTLMACGGGDYSPKPQAYLRINTPEASYIRIDTLPFSFEKNTAATLIIKKDTRHELWVDLSYPQWDGVVFLTYKRLRSSEDLRGQIDTSSRLLEKHYQFASGIDEQVFESDDHTVHAVKWHLKGKNVASTYQFYATDSLHHFLRGAVYINHAPNNDSLAPVLEYMHRDVDRLIESLHWR